MNHHLSHETTIDFAHGELTPEADAAVHLHLAECALCHEHYEAEMRLGEALRAAARAEELDFPPVVAARVWERVRQKRALPFGLGVLLRPVVALPLAAALAVTAYLGTPLWRSTLQAHTVTAAYYLEQHAGQSASDPLTERGSGLVMEASTIDVSPAGAVLERNPQATDSTDALR